MRVIYVMRRFLIFLIMTSVLWSHVVNIKAIGEGSENPKLDSAYVEVSPEIQGVGGALTILTSVQVNGTC